MLLNVSVFSFLLLSNILFSKYTSFCLSTCLTNIWTFFSKFLLITDKVVKNILVQVFYLYLFIFLR